MPVERACIIPAKGKVFVFFVSVSGRCMLWEAVPNEANICPRLDRTFVNEQTESKEAKMVWASEPKPEAKKDPDNTKPGDGK